MVFYLAYFKSDIKKRKFKMVDPTKLKKINEIKFEFRQFFFYQVVILLRLCFIIFPLLPYKVLYNINNTK